MKYLITVVCRAIGVGSVLAFAELCAEIPEWTGWGAVGAAFLLVILAVEAVFFLMVQVKWGDTA